VFADFDCVHLTIITDVGSGPGRPDGKLARPDVFHPRIVLAGCAGLIEGDGDDDGLVAALRGRGLHARWKSWDDAGALDADLVILRATRDYRERLDEFLTWTTRVRHLLNAPSVVAWNASRGYLGDLAARGVPTAGRTVATAGRTRDEEAEQTALVLLGGRQSHAFTGVAQADPDFEVWDVGVLALRAAAGQLGIDVSELLYARADVIGGRDDPRLLKLDLVDPSLGWRRLDPETRSLRQRDFTLCVESALERLGLGPFSRRRP
jgi:hypothetical protein